MAVPATEGTSDEHDMRSTLEPANGTQSTLHVGYSQYVENQAISDVHSGPEIRDRVNETQVESDRPVSAGSIRSEHLAEEDINVLSACVATPNDRHWRSIEPETNLGTGSLLSRPDASDAMAADVSFTFSKASTPHQLDLKGTRKGPAANDQPSELASVERQDNTHELESQVVNLHTATTTAPTSPDEFQNMQDVYPMPDNPAVYQELTAPPRKKTKRSKRRYNTAPSQQLDVEMMDYRLGVIEPESRTNSPHNNHKAADENPAVFEPLNDVEEAQGLTTPMATAAGEEDQPYCSSPHSQLQQDLKAASNSSKEAHNIGRSSLRQESDRYTSPDVGSQPQEAPPADDYAVRQNENGEVHGTAYDHTSRGISRMSRSKGVSKKKSKPSRRATPRPSIQDVESREPPSEVDDYIQILQFKNHEKRKIAEARFAEELEVLEDQLRDVMEAKETFQSELSTALQQKQKLVEEVETHNKKIKLYESKFSKLKPFTDGLGRDFHNLQKYALSTQTKCTELAEELKEAEAERIALRKQMDDCTERSAELKHFALRTCQDAQGELQAALLQSDYLDQQLSDKVGLLAEERDRRSHLERQLATAVGADEKIVDALTSKNNEVLDKLYEIQQSSPDHNGAGGLSETLEKIAAFIQSLNAQPGVTSADVESIKGLIETLGESMTDRLHGSSVHQQHEQNVAAAFRTHIHEALKKLHASIGDLEKHNQREKIQQQAFHALQEKLKVCEAQVAHTKSEIVAAEKREGQLKEQNASLQARLIDLQSEFSPTENAQVQLSEANAEMMMKAQALDTVRAELTFKKEEMRTLTASNTQLQDQIEGFHIRLQNAQTTVADFSPERKALHKKAHLETERVRKEMAEHIEKFEAEVRTQTGNEVKKLTSERSRLEKQLKPLSEELMAKKQCIEGLQREKETACVEAERFKKMSQSQKEEIETLLASISNLQNSIKEKTSPKEEVSKISAQLNTETTKLQKVSEDNTALLKQLADVQQTAKDAKRSEERAKNDLSTCRTDKDALVDELEKKLAEAEETAERSAAGLEHFKDSCKGAIDNANNKTERQIKALQERLSEALIELQKNKEEDERFRAEVEQSWQQEQRAFEDQTADIRQKVVDTEAQKDGIMQNNERLRSDLQKVINEQTEKLGNLQRRADRAEEDLRSKQPWPSTNPNSSSSLRVPPLKEGITPTTRADLLPPPPKPRKKVDRQSNTTIDVGPVPAPDEIRPESRRTGSAKSMDVVRGPVVAETQDSLDVARAGPSTTKWSTRPMPSMTSSDNDDMLTIRGSGQTHLLPDTIPETQADESLPSFAAFNNSLTSTHFPNSQATSSLTTRPPVWPCGSYADHPLQARSSPRGLGGPFHHRRHAEEPHEPENFTIYEDSNGKEGAFDLGGSGLRKHFTGDSVLSQEEISKYTYQKSFPNPNSASKMAPLEGDGLRRRTSESQRSGASQQRTPAVRDESKGSLVEGSHLAGLSSSPDFINNSASRGRRVSTYQAPGGSGGKRRSSTTQSALPVDPRLAGRAAPKRKAERPIVEGYEHERKKRLSGTTHHMSSDTGRSNPRLQAHQSINDVSRFPTMPSGPSSSQYNCSNTSSQSRMRTLAGRSSRTTKGVKKLSKKDEYDARFSLELNGR